MLRRLLALSSMLLLWATTAAAAWVFEPGKNIANEPFQFLCSHETLDWKAVLSRRAELPYTGRHNFGFQKDLECWSLITIENKGSKIVRSFLEHRLPYTSRLELFQIINSQVVQHKTLGLDIPFREWMVDYRLPIFDLNLEPGENLILVRQTATDIFMLDWRLYDPDRFYSRIVPELLLFGGFFAVCIVLSAYNLVIFFVNRETSHVFYFFYLNLYGLAQFYLAGLFKQIFFHNLGSSLYQFGIVFINLALIFTICFFYFFLDFQNYKRWFQRLVRVFVTLLFCNIVLAILDQTLLAAAGSYLGSALVSMYAILCSVIAIRQRHPLARYFIAAWSVLIVGNVVQILHLLGILPDNPWIVSLNFVGASFEAILISYALAYKMRVARIQESQRRQHAYSQLEKMVYPHQVARMKQGGILESTMPHASGEGTIICLDIIASTSSQIQDLSNFLRHFLDRCHDLMSGDYDGEQLCASGFRIKELGDGFLCSVGFPFGTPPGRSNSEVAIQLAFSFLAAFDEEFSRAASGKHTYCSLGIAQGPLQGSFTVSGIRSYELFGESIVLATRYESLRKQWPPDRQGHIITLQSRFFESLSPHYQRLFTCHKLDTNKAMIRNDAEAHAFYRGIFSNEDVTRFAQQKPAHKLLKAV